MVIFFPGLVWVPRKAEPVAGHGCESFIWEVMEEVGNRNKGRKSETRKVVKLVIDMVSNWLL